MKINTFKKVAVSTMALAMGAALVGSISGSIAWYQYSTRSTVSYSGASAHCTESLQVRVYEDAVPAVFTLTGDLAVDGAKTYFYINIGNMAAGEDWMTHLSANAPTGTRNAGKALGSVDFTKTVEFADENLKLTVISDTTKGQNDGQDHFYGAVGFRVEAAVEAAEE